jgi:hypothetical protein
MKTANPIKLALERSLPSEGFKRKGSDWYLDTKESIVVVNLQKSNYGQQYYINIGIWLKALGDSRYPPEHKCHVTIRAGDLSEEFSEEFSSKPSLLDLERTVMANDVRIEQLERLVRTGVLPWIRSCVTVAGLRAQLHSGARWTTGVKLKAREFLENSKSSS